MNTTLINVFDVRGIVPSEFVPPGQTVNQTYFKVLRRLHLQSSSKKDRVVVDWRLKEELNSCSTRVLILNPLYTAGNLFVSECEHLIQTTLSLFT
ncbi:hypothetical protein J6590_032100 [Homalodisca vitripennis]|nr:hypothetical protein J6590_032100 [Homalodisca vitripennis]